MSSIPGQEVSSAVPLDSQRWRQAPSAMNLARQDQSGHRACRVWWSPVFHTRKYHIQAHGRPSFKGLGVSGYNLRSDWSAACQRSLVTPEAAWGLASALPTPFPQLTTTLPLHTLSPQDLLLTAGP